MPKLVSAPPKYRHHKASGQAVVRISGRDFYLGPWKSKASKVEYDRLIGEWIANGRRAATPGEPDLTISELILAYWKRCEGHYSQNGEPTSELGLVRHAMRPLRALYGHTLASKFGPLALKAVRESLVETGLSRNVVNSHVSRIKRMFRWAVENELVGVEVYQALATVAGLQRGRTTARESARVQPVDEAVITATMAHVPEVVAAMIRFQRLTGARPAEICLIRPCDIDTSGDVWSYRPEAHKTEHLGRERVIFIGPRAQEVIRPFLLRDKQARCFVPAESERKRNAERREQRQTPMTPSQAKRRPRPRRRRPPGGQYTTHSYRRAIERACDLAWPAADELHGAELKAWRKAHRWSPNRLRHSAATEIRKRFGLEGSQVILGHSSADVTQIYAERDLEKAAAIMREVG